MILHPPVLKITGKQNASTKSTAIRPQARQSNHNSAGRLENIIDMKLLLMRPLCETSSELRDDVDLYQESNQVQDAS